MISGKPPETDERPPFFGTWNRIYIVVVAYVIALTVALYWMTVALNR